MVSYLVRGEADFTEGKEGLVPFMEQGIGPVGKGQILEAFRLYVSLHSQLLEVTDDFRLVVTDEVVDEEIYIQRAYGIFRQIAKWGNLDWEEFVPEEFKEAIREQMRFDDELNRKVWGLSGEPSSSQVNQAPGP